RARVGEEHAGVGVQQRQQLLGEEHAGLVDEQVAGVRDLLHLGGHRADNRRVRVAEGGGRDPRDQVEVLVAVNVPHVAAFAAIEGQRGHAVVAHHRGREPLLQGRAVDRGVLAHGVSPITMVPMPESVKISSRIAWVSRPSRTWARGTPPVTAVRQASIFGIMPADRVGSSFSRSSASSWLITSSEFGQSRYSPSTSVSTTSLAAPSATARAAAAVSAFTL